MNTGNILSQSSEHIFKVQFSSSIKNPAYSINAINYDKNKKKIFFTVKCVNNLNNTTSGHK